MYTPIVSSRDSLSDHPPLPGGAPEQEQRKHTRLRRRIMEGMWRGDLIDHLSQHFDQVRRHLVGKPDISTNLLRSVVQQLSALYDQEPQVRHEVGEDAIAVFLDAVRGAGLWQLSMVNQQNVLSLRDALIRPSWSPEAGLMFRLVTPDMVYMEAPPDDPDLPWYVVEARQRMYRGKLRWTWDVADVRDPSNPTFQVLLHAGERSGKPILVDLTEELLGGSMSVASYPFRFADGGEPYVPYSLYHAKRTGKLVDPYDGRELVDGTLTVAVLWTYWIHCVRDSAWAQKWTLDAFLRGGSGQEADTYAQHRAVSTDPTMVMQFRSDGQNAASMGQWNPPVDPATLGKAVSDYEGRLGVHFDIGPQDFERSGDAESGYAIALKRASVREAQRRFAPQFMRGDQRLLSITAAMLNGVKALPAAVPESGYTIEYPGLPKTADEVESELAEVERQVALGLASKVDAYMMLHSGVDRVGALEALQQIEMETRMLAAGAGPAVGAGAGAGAQPAV